MKVSLFLTNTTRNNFEQHYEFGEFPRVVRIPAYGLNIEEIFQEEAERDLFLKLISSKLDAGEIVIGTSKAEEAEKENEKVESEIEKTKATIHQQADKEFEDYAEFKLAGTNAEVKVTQIKGKKSDL